MHNSEKHKIGDLLFSEKMLGVIVKINSLEGNQATYQIDWVPDGANNYRREWFQQHEIEDMKKCLNNIS